MMTICGPPGKEGIGRPVLEYERKPTSGRDPYRLNPCRAVLFRVMPVKTQAPSRASLRTIYSTQYFRRPTQEELDRRLWSTTWYRLAFDSCYHATVEDALAAAEKEWTEEDYEAAFLIRYEARPDLLGAREM